MLTLILFMSGVSIKLAPFTSIKKPRCLLL